MRTLLAIAIAACVAMVSWTAGAAEPAASAPAAASRDWPQFMGPTGDNISPAKGLPRKFPEGGPKQLWKINVGRGFGSPALEAPKAAGASGRLYLLDRAGDTQDIMLCLDLTSGEELWKTPFDAPGESRGYPGSRGTPAVDNKCVYAIGAFGGLYCVDKADGKLVWQANIIKDFESRTMQWGVGQSPVLYKDTVIVAPLGRAAGVVAYNKADGKIAWKSEPMRRLAYVSPQLTKIGGVDQVLVISSTAGGQGSQAVSQLAALDAATGKPLWTYEGWVCSIAIPGPVNVGDGKLFLTGGYGAGSAMIQVKKEGDAWTVKELFKQKTLNAQIHNPVLWKGYLYANGNSNENRDGLVCLDLNGQIKWKTGENRFARGGYLVADGVMYIIDGNDDKGGPSSLTLVELSPEGYKQLDTCPVLEGKVIWAPPALADGKLVVRDQSSMICLDLMAK